MDDIRFAHDGEWVMGSRGLARSIACCCFYNGVVCSPLAI